MMRAAAPLLAVTVALSGACGDKREVAPGTPAPAATPAKTTSPGAADSPPAAVSVPPAPPIEAVPLGLPTPTPAPAGETDSAERVALGELLFFDPRLSESGRYACATCHQPDKGWADGKPTSVRYDRRRDGRHTPTLYNAAYADAWYWDGRALTLEALIVDAWLHKVGGDPAEAADRLQEVPAYAVRFERAFGEPASPDNIARALASFVRIATRHGDSPWDRYERGGDGAQVSAAARAGFEVFSSKARCAQCHAPPLYTDGRYYAMRVGQATEGPRDLGRGGVSQLPAERGAFKTPSLRGVADHPPYLHDGSAATLAEAVDAMVPEDVVLSERERADLIEFLRALGASRPPHAPPALP